MGGEGPARRSFAPPSPIGADQPLRLLGDEKIFYQQHEEPGKDMWAVSQSPLYKNAQPSYGFSSSYGAPSQRAEKELAPIDVMQPGGVPVPANMPTSPWFGREFPKGRHRPMKHPYSKAAMYPNDKSVQNEWVTPDCDPQFSPTAVSTFARDFAQPYFGGAIVPNLVGYTGHGPSHRKPEPLEIELMEPEVPEYGRSPHGRRTFLHDISPRRDGNFKEVKLPKSTVERILVDKETPYYAPFLPSGRTETQYSASGQSIPTSFTVDVMPLDPQPPTVKQFANGPLSTEQRLLPGGGTIPVVQAPLLVKGPNTVKLTVPAVVNIKSIDGDPAKVAPFLLSQPGVAASLVPMYPNVLRMPRHSHCPRCKDPAVHLDCAAQAHGVPLPLMHALLPVAPVMPVAAPALVY